MTPEVTQLSNLYVFCLQAVEGSLSHSPKLLLSYINGLNTLSRASNIATAHSYVCVIQAVEVPLKVSQTVAIVYANSVTAAAVRATIHNLCSTHVVWFCVIYSSCGGPLKVSQTAAIISYFNHIHSEVVQPHVKHPSRGTISHSQCRASPCYFAYRLLRSP